MRSDMDNTEHTKKNAKDQTYFSCDFLAFLEISERVWFENASNADSKLICVWCLPYVFSSAWYKAKDFDKRNLNVASGWMLFRWKMSEVSCSSCLVWFFVCVNETGSFQKRICLVVWHFAFFTLWDSILSQNQCVSYVNWLNWRI